MTFPKRIGLCTAIFISLGVSAASAANLSSLSLKCANKGGDSCSKLEKELEGCKKIPECVASLPPLPDSVLAEISADQSNDQAIRAKADGILSDRKQERAARALRRANFQNLRVGMTVAEVEATIGPINPSVKSLANTAASPEMREVEQIGGGELHYVFTDDGWSQKMGGGDPKNSTYSFEGSEYSLVFDHEGKLKEFQYRGAN